MSVMEKRSTQAEVRLQSTIATLQQELEQRREEHHKEVWRNRSFVMWQLSWFAWSDPHSLPPSFQLSSRRVGSCWRCRIISPAACVTLRSSWASGCNRPETSLKRQDLPLPAYTLSFTAKNSSYRMLMRPYLSRCMTHWMVSYKTTIYNSSIYYVYIKHPYIPQIACPRDAGAYPTILDRWQGNKLAIPPQGFY